MKVSFLKEAMSGAGSALSLAVTRLGCSDTRLGWSLGIDQALGCADGHRLLRAVGGSCVTVSSLIGFGFLSPLTPLSSSPPHPLSLALSFPSSL